MNILPYSLPQVEQTRLVHVEGHSCIPTTGEYRILTPSSNKADAELLWETVVLEAHCHLL
jgi:hypothetical protein